MGLRMLCTLYRNSPSTPMAATAFAVRQLKLSPDDEGMMLRCGGGTGGGGRRSNANHASTTGPAPRARRVRRRPARIDPAATAAVIRGDAAESRRRRSGQRYG